MGAATERLWLTVVGTIAIVGLLLSVAPFSFDFEDIEQAEHVARWRDN